MLTAQAHARPAGALLAHLPLLAATPLQTMLPQPQPQQQQTMPPQQPQQPQQPPPQPQQQPQPQQGPTGTLPVSAADNPASTTPAPTAAPLAIAPVSAPVQEATRAAQLLGTVTPAADPLATQPPGSALVSAPAGSTNELLPPTALSALSADYHPHAGHHAAPPASASKVTLGTLVR